VRPARANALCARTRALDAKIDLLVTETKSFSPTTKGIECHTQQIDVKMKAFGLVVCGQDQMVQMGDHVLGSKRPRLWTRAKMAG
jgi:hypothetical protein